MGDFRNEHSSRQRNNSLNAVAHASVCAAALGSSGRGARTSR